MRTAPDAGRGRFLNRATRGGYAAPCARRLSDCRRFNNPIVNLSRPSMTRRDSEVVSPPLADQRQEDGLRHRSVGTLDPPIPFWVTRLPRESYVWSLT